MDPISAAGIGLSVTSLTFQVFAGCLKGYQFFLEAEGMPASYQHLRVRLHIEQTRLLNWGEKIGLVEELLDEPSRVLRQNRNLIIDILLEIQALLKNCVAIQAKYDLIVPQKPVDTQTSDYGGQINDQKIPKGMSKLLSKTLDFLEKTPEAPKRLQWALVKQERFKQMVEKLIDYNTAIEALLDDTTINQLLLMQQQTYMAMLQLNNNVTELKEISKAMHVKSETNLDVARKENTLASSFTEIQGASREEFSLLADFKAQQMQIESKSSFVMVKPVSVESVSLQDSNELRAEAVHLKKRVWVEWKNYIADPNGDSKWNRTIEDRIKKLANLLGSAQKPPQFNAPQCLGYFHDRDYSRFGFLYSKPPNLPQETRPTSLFDHIQSTSFVPSLTDRIAVAHRIARCLMYLHSVNWLHKGLRSDNILFFVAEGQSLDYTHPYIAGFEYARPDYPDEETEPPPEHSEHDVYRHPEIISRTTSRSQKSHDIYSLGIVLVEIAYWKCITDIMEIPNERKAARSRARKVRNLLLTGDCLQSIRGSMGNAYSDAVMRCLTGGKELGIEDHADQGDMHVGVRMQEVFAKEVVNKIGNIRV